MAINGKLYIAGPFGEAQIKKIQEHFTRMLGEEVILRTERDDDLIGGFLAMVDGKVYDGSMLMRIKDMQRYMLDKEQSGA